MDLFVVANSQYHLRRHDFVIPRFRTVAYGKRSLTYLGTVIWSILDISIRLSHWTLAKSVLNWLISQACWTLSCPILSTRHEWKNTFDNLYERTICHDSRSPLDPTDRVFAWKMYRISSLKQRSDMNHSRVQGRYTVYPTFFKQLKIRHKSREGTSALHIVYVSFVKDFLHSYDSTTITQGPFPTWQTTKFVSPLNEMHLSTRQFTLLGRQTFSPFVPLVRLDYRWPVLQVKRSSLIHESIQLP